MGLIRERFSGPWSGEVTFGEKSKHAGPQLGAAMQKRMLAFVPLRGNAAFNQGRGKSFAYAYLYAIDFDRDYSELVLTFSGYVVRVTGRNLKATLDAIEAFRCELVEQVDPLVAAGPVDADACVVTGLELVAQGEG